MVFVNFYNNYYILNKMKLLNHIISNIKNIFREQFKMKSIMNYRILDYNNIIKI